MVVKISSNTELLLFLIASFITGVLLYHLAVACVNMIFLPFAEIKEKYFACCNNPAAWTFLAVHVTIIVTIFVIVLLFSTLIRKLIAKRSLLFRCKCLSLIGHGGIALCGIVPRISVYVFGGNVGLYINGYIAFISFVTSFAIYFIILLPNAKNFKVDYDLNGTWSWFWKHVVIHIIVLIIQIRIAIALFEDKNIREVIIFIQFLYSIICVPSIFDLCQVLRGGVKLRNYYNKRTYGSNKKQKYVLENAEIGAFKETRNTEPRRKFKLEYKNCNKNNQNQGLVAGNEKNVKAAEILPEHTFKVDCKICMLEYSETRIPRNLKECGHTVCEVCANQLLKKNNQKYLCCPFCQEVTMVKGDANLLPKNYGMLELIEQKK